MGTAVKRRTLEFPLYDIRMQEDCIQGIADLMDYLPSNIAQQGTALDLPRHLLQALLESLLTLREGAVEGLAHSGRQCKFSKALAQGGQFQKLSLGLFSVRHGIISSCTRHPRRSHTRAESRRERGAEMLVHVVHREHTLSLLRMQS